LVWKIRFAEQHLKCRKPWQVITLTRRDPIARNVSSLFETIERWIPGFEERCANNDLGLAQLSEFYLAEFHEKLDFYEMPFQWFHVELEQFFGIDILESEFPRTTGYKIYSEAVKKLFAGGSPIDHEYAILAP